MKPTDPMDLPLPSGRMTVTYGLDRKVRVPVWDEAAMRSYAAKIRAAERKRCLDLLDEHARAADVWYVTGLIKGGPK